MKTNPHQNEQVLEQVQRSNRRQFLNQAQLGLGAIALGSLGANSASAGLPQESDGSELQRNSLGLPNHAPKAKRVIYMFQSGAPSQFELFDYKPKLEELQTQELPDSVRMGQRLTGMTQWAKEFSVSAFHF